MSCGKRPHFSAPELLICQKRDSKFSLLSDIGNALLKNKHIIRRETTCKAGYTTAQSLNLCHRLMGEVNSLELYKSVASANTYGGLKTKPNHKEQGQQKMTSSKPR